MEEKNILIEEIYAFNTPSWKIRIWCEENIKDRETIFDFITYDSNQYKDKIELGKKILSFGGISACEVINTYNGSGNCFYLDWP
ncbi:MAG: hypothetical protein AABY22_19155 [Nanoarchaeota archaeon]